MSFRINALGLAAMVALAAPGSAFAYSGLGCTNLPEYDRAVGALQGMPSACDMTIEQAKRIVAAHDGVPVEGAAPSGRRRVATPQP